MSHLRRARVLAVLRLSSQMVTVNPPANAQTAHSPGRVALTPNPVKPPKGKAIKRPDSGKPIAGAKIPEPVLDKIPLKPISASSKGGHFTKVGDDDYVGPSGKHFNYNQVRAYYSNGASYDGGLSEDVAMGAGWAQAIRQKLKGEKKAVSARKKSDKADAARAAMLKSKASTITAPAAPFVPRVQLSAKTVVTVSKKHPINPLKIKPPKGSSQAPGKSIGPINAVPTAAPAAAMRERTKAVLRVKK